MNARRYLGPTLVLVIFLLSLFALHQLLHDYRYREISAELKTLTHSQLGTAIALTALSYLVMSGYDALALRYIGRRLAPGQVVFASFVSYAFSNSVGVSILTSGSLRYRLYGGWGLSALEIGKIVAFCALSLWLGIIMASGTLLLIAPGTLPAALGFPDAKRLGYGLIALVAVYLTLCHRLRSPLRLRGKELALPPPRLTLLQLGIGTLDWMLAGSVLYALLPQGFGVHFGQFVGTYLIAQMLGLLSHVPGGLGVFESLMLALLPGHASPTALIGAILAYRLIYYLLPLGLAALGLAGYEALRFAAPAKTLAKQLGPAISWSLPHLYAAWALVSGSVLLLSGATPALLTRMVWLKELLPLPLVEISHFLASISGMGLLLLARGIQRRLNAAWWLTVALLALGIGLSLLKGADYEEALILALLLIALLPARSQFYRLSSLLDESFSPEWYAAIGAVIVGSTWLGFFAYKHVEFANDLWWRFSFGETGNAPRFMRAQVGVLVVAILFGVARLMRHPRSRLLPPDPHHLAAATSLMQACPDTSAHLVSTGDKHLLIAENNEGFLMYGVEGRSWVSTGDPVGSETAKTELAWQFRELAERHGGWTVFYQAKPEHLGIYVDLGLSLVKIGEEARVDLADFSLQGHRMKGLRGTVNKLEKEGYRFEVVAAEEVRSMLPRLKYISDAWLSRKHTREKRFSLGFFDPQYLIQGPMALVTLAGNPVAFANLWLGAELHEASIDLMRQLPHTHAGLMDFLFVQLMLWAKAQGYRWFNLGMAPLSGLPDHTLAPAWNRFGTAVFGHGEYFYNFQGIYQYKDKFQPNWEPRYLALPAKHNLPLVLINIAALIAGGASGIASK